MPKLSLTLSGNIQSYITVPNFVGFDRIPKTGKHTKEFTIKTSEGIDTTFHILSLKPTANYMTANYKTIADGKEYLVTMRIDADEALKVEKQKFEDLKKNNPATQVPEDISFNGAVTIETDYEKKKIIGVNYSGALVKK